MGRKTEPIGARLSSADLRRLRRIELMLEALVEAENKATMPDSDSVEQTVKQRRGRSRRGRGRPENRRSN